MKKRIHERVDKRNWSIPFILWGSGVLVGSAALAGNQGSDYLIGMITLLSMEMWRSWKIGPYQKRAYFFTFDPEKPEGQPLMSGMHELIETTAREKKAVWLRIQAPIRPKRFQPTLELDIDGDVVLTNCGPKRLHLNLPHSWIADHPLPLPIARDRACTLHFIPTAGPRVRVQMKPDTLSNHRAALFMAVILTGIACYFDFHMLLTALLVWTGYQLVSNRFAS